MDARQFLRKRSAIGDERVSEGDGRPARSPEDGVFRRADDRYTVDFALGP